MTGVQTCALPILFCFCSVFVLFCSVFVLFLFCDRQRLLLILLTRSTANCMIMFDNLVFTLILIGHQTVCHCFTDKAKHSLLYCIILYYAVLYCVVRISRIADSALLFLSFVYFCIFFNFCTFFNYYFLLIFPLFFMLK